MNLRNTPPFLDNATGKYMEGARASSPDLDDSTLQEKSKNICKGIHQR